MTLKKGIKEILTQSKFLPFITKLPGHSHITVAEVKVKWPYLKAYSES